MIPVIVKVLMAWIAGILLSELRDRIWVYVGGAIVMLVWIVAEAIIVNKKDIIQAQMRLYVVREITLLTAFLFLGMLKSDCDKPIVCQHQITRKCLLEICTEGVAKPKTVAYRVRDCIDGREYLLYLASDSVRQAHMHPTIASMHDAFPASDSASYITSNEFVSNNLASNSSLANGSVSNGLSIAFSSASLLPADIIKANAVIYPLNDSIEYHKYLYRQGLSGTMYVKEIQERFKDLESYKNIEAPIVTNDSQYTKDTRYVNNTRYTNDSYIVDEAQIFKSQSISDVGLLGNGIEPLFLNTIRRLSAQVRAWCLVQLKTHSPLPSVLALAQGCLLGDRSGLDSDVMTDFSYAGMSHILAVSGMHIGILFSLFWFFLWPIRVLGQHKLCRWLVLILLWAYVMIIGMSTSAVRAAVMITMGCLAWIIRRDALNWSNFAVAAFVLLAYNSQLVWSVSFQMSFAATASILIFRLEIKKLNQMRAKNHLKFSKPNPRAESKALAVETKSRSRVCFEWAMRQLCLSVMELLLISFAAQAFTLPLVLFYFGHLPWLSFVPTLLVLPILSLYLMLLVLLLATHACIFFWCTVPNLYQSLLQSLADIFWFVVDLLSQWILWIAHATRQWDEGYIPAQDWHLGGWHLAVCYTMLFLLLVMWRRCKWRNYCIDI